MMTEEIHSIPDKTWERAADPITKVGYMDGAADGQAAAFQPSFDEGYKLGFNFGLEIGFKEAILRVEDQIEKSIILADSRKINCQVCLNPELLKEDLCNLINIQKDKNNEHLEVGQVVSMR